MPKNSMAVTRTVYHGYLDDRTEYDNSFAHKVFNELPMAFDRYRKYYPDVDIEPPDRLGAVDVEFFSDKEVFAESRNSVQGKSVFLIHEFRGYNGEFDPNVGAMAQFVAVDALYRAGADNVYLVTPFQPYQRQERKTKPRTPITAAVFAKFTQRFVDKLITADMHTGALEGFYDIPVINLEAMPLFVKYYKEKGGVYVPVSPDAGGVPRAEKMGELLDSPEQAFISKRTIGKNRKKATKLTGDVRGHYVVLLDDMIDTGGSLIEAVELLYKNGAVGIDACVTHGILSDSLDDKGSIRKAADRIMDSKINKFLVTDTIDLGEDFFKEYGEKFVEVSMAPPFANVMTRLHAEKPVSPYLREYYGLFDEDV